ncbi:uncharacterized protein FIBRA_01690 [Fibroporia radiculosa]|uniref:Uncharacterized protein n=1 Tax=Fibroporia radiculosa TaxID=599839 RepID=J4H1C7_9APHY|nr:uncharacterized protein FIBRA_01690 [Fibroporia radiculosa]CCL99669.1 predicted protein [Fibroporia radiculosa]
MDDLYTNAWGDPAEALPALKLSTSSASSWRSPKPNPPEDEADLAAPSWSTGAEIKWDEPSEGAGFSWTQTDPDLAWSTSTVQDIQLGKPADTPQTEEEEDEVLGVLPAPSLYAAEIEVVKEEYFPSTLPVEEEVLATAALSPVFAPPSPTPDQDGFGTFESAVSPNANTPISVEHSEHHVDEWGAAWASAPPAAQDEPEDEWETATRQKAQQDRRVPPEVLKSIVNECEQFARVVWPEATPEANGEANGWKNSWRGGLEDVEGLDSFLQTFLPSLSLQPPAKFGETAIAKGMATSVRLTRNLSITSSSPMSHYLAAKGSTAWEVAVKERKEVVEDDVPVGWRILEKELAVGASDSAADANKNKRSSSRLFSFWGRKEPTISSHTRSSSLKDVVDPSLSEVQSPNGLVEVSASTHSRQASQESGRSPTRASVDKDASPVNASLSPVPVQSTVSAPTTVSPPPQMSSYSTAEVIDTPSLPAPSAVSRFLNRFSRNKGPPGASSARSSLALTSDDLEFLSDLVPSASDDGDDDHVDHLKALTSVVKPQSLPPILPPPPSVVSQNARAPSSVGSAAQSAVDSLDSLFDTPNDFLNPSAERSTSSLNVVSLQSTLDAPILQPSRPTTTAGAIAGSSKWDARPSSPSPLAIDATKSTPQSFFLPSPPSSRSQTPFNVASQPAFAAPQPVGFISSMDKTSRGDGSSSRIKAPPSFPPPRSSATSPVVTPPQQSPSTPTSSMPLAQLYPNAHKANMAASSAAAMKAVKTFSLPPPPSFRPQSSNALPPPLAPPPSVSVRNLDARRPPSLPLSSFDDDDEFSDFMSSATMPPNSTHSSVPSTASPTTNSPFLLKSPTTQPLKAPQYHPPKRKPFNNFSDIYSSSAILRDSKAPSNFDSSSPSDFQSPTSATLFQSDSDSSFQSHSHDDSFSSEKSFLTSGQSSFGFDDNAISPALRTPSPPRPPSKKRIPLVPFSLSKPTGSELLQTDASSNSRLDKAASHLHTLNLMERAAAHPGRWPAPPSPGLPGPIPGPSSAVSLPQIDLLGDGSPKRPSGDLLSSSQSSPALLNPVRATSSLSGLGISATPKPPSMLSHSQSAQGTVSDFQLFGSPMGGTSQSSLQPVRPSSTAPVPSNTQPAAKTGGLSAQDLLFFEGL